MSNDKLKKRYQQTLIDFPRILHEIEAQVKFRVRTLYYFRFVNKAIKGIILNKVKRSDLPDIEELVKKYKANTNPEKDNGKFHKLYRAWESGAENMEDIDFYSAEVIEAINGRTDRKNPIDGINHQLRSKILQDFKEQFLFEFNDWNDFINNWKRLQRKRNYLAHYGENTMPPQSCFRDSNVEAYGCADVKEAEQKTYAFLMTILLPKLRSEFRQDVKAATDYYVVKETEKRNKLEEENHHLINTDISELYKEYNNPKALRKDINNRTNKGKHVERALKKFGLENTYKRDAKYKFSNAYQHYYFIGEPALESYKKLFTRYEINSEDLDFRDYEHLYYLDSKINKIVAEYYYNYENTYKIIKPDFNAEKDLSVQNRMIRNSNAHCRSIFDYKNYNQTKENDQTDQFLIDNLPYIRSRLDFLNAFKNKLNEIYNPDSGQVNREGCLTVEKEFHFINRNVCGAVFKHKNIDEISDEEIKYNVIEKSKEIDGQIGEFKVEYEKELKSFFDYHQYTLFEILSILHIEYLKLGDKLAGNYRIKKNSHPEEAKKYILECDKLKKSAKNLPQAVYGILERYKKNIQSEENHSYSENLLPFIKEFEDDLEVFKKYIGKYQGNSSELKIPDHIAYDNIEREGHVQNNNELQYIEKYKNKQEEYKSAIDNNAANYEQTLVEIREINKDYHRYLIGLGQANKENLFTEELVKIEDKIRRCNLYIEYYNKIKEYYDLQKNDKLDENHTNKLLSFYQYYYQKNSNLFTSERKEEAEQTKFLKQLKENNKIMSNIRDLIFNATGYLPVYHKRYARNEKEVEKTQALKIKFLKITGEKKNTGYLDAIFDSILNRDKKLGKVLKRGMVEFNNQKELHLIQQEIEEKTDTREDKKYYNKLYSLRAMYTELNPIYNKIKKVELNEDEKNTIKKYIKRFRRIEDYEETYEYLKEIFENYY